jgi:hypothetical protein
MTTLQIHDDKAWQWQLVLLRIIILVAAVGVGAAVTRLSKRPECPCWRRGRCNAPYIPSVQQDEDHAVFL